MKKTIMSAGLLVLGAATLHAQRTPYAPAPDLTSKELSKPWSVAVSLRGFYDDNQFTRHSGPGKDDAFGAEISPSFSLNWTLPQTYMGLSYLYGYRTYDSRPGRDYDQTHQVRARLNHTFSERMKLDVSESFVSAQEPELLSGGAVIPVRSEGNNIHNAASIGLTSDLTEKLGLYLSYSNNFYDYDQDARDLAGPGNPAGAGSYSALLDRMEHLGTINLRWQALPETVGILGYQYGVTDYRSSDLISLGSNRVGKDRNSDSHYVYLGADHSFNSQLQGALRIGAQFVSYDDVNQDTTSPYADASLTYNYTPDSYAMLGVRHMRNATDIATVNGANEPVLDQETTTGYLSISHKLSAKVTCGLLAQVQHSTFEGGGIDGDKETFFLSGVNVIYNINEFLSAEAGYNYDRLTSDVADRSYTRNRVYIGIRASY